MNQDFISEKEFLDEMSVQWDLFGNDLGDFHSAWREILRCFNNQLSGKKGLHVCDSVCGSGKTLAAEVSSVILSKNWEDIGTLIVVRLNEQCLDVSRRINKISLRLMGRPLAKPMFSQHTTAEGKVIKGHLTSDEIKETQVLVITHANYLKTISGQKTDLFSNWERGKRRFRIIDESLDLVEKFELNKQGLSQIRWFFEMRKDYSNFYQKYETHMQLFNDIYTHCTLKINAEGFYSQAFVSLLDKHTINGNQIYFQELKDVIIKSKPNDYDVRWREGDFAAKVEEVVKFIDTLDRIIRRTIYFCKDEGKTYSTAEITLPNQFDSLCVLDATSNVDGVYKMFKKKEQVSQYHVDRSVRNFSNCTIHYRPVKNLGKGSTTKQLVPRCQKIINWAKQEVGPEDKVLFAGHKCFMQRLASDLKGRDVDFEWDVCWWNAIDGKNTWKDFNKLVIVSIPYLPVSYDNVTKLGFHTAMNPDIELKETGSELADSNILVKLIQVIARIKTRLVLKGGHCPVSDVFILLPSKGDDDIHPDDEDEIEFKYMLNDFSQYVLNKIQDNMNGVNVQQWMSFTGFSKPKKKTVQPKTVGDKFILWAKTIVPGETKDKDEFIRNLSASEKNSLQVQISNPKSRISTALAKFRVKKNSTRGRGGKTTFTKMEN